MMSSIFLGSGPTTGDILRRGYFPKELPPPFTTKDFASKYATMQSPSKNDSLCLRYSYSKYSSVRRTLSIPNPAYFLALAKVISDNWADIDRHCRRSTISKTHPMLDSERAIRSEFGLDDIPKSRVEIRLGTRYVLKADIASFYGSIYTHAIPWAYHTKVTAKTDRGTSKSTSGGPPLFGNIMDLVSRNIQSGQTIGIPIGPDTSLVIAESILTPIDEYVVSKIGSKAPNFRFLDDYEFACGSLAEAERTLGVLQDALAEFELHLNPRKTEIIELPSALDTSWVHDLVVFPLDSTKRAVLENQLLRYVSLAFEIARTHPGEPVLKYAVRRLVEVDLSDLGLTAIRPLLQRLLFQSATVDPGTLHTALFVAYRDYQVAGVNAIDKAALAKTISEIIKRHAPLQHGGDVAWALWAALVFDITLDESVVKALDTLLDPVAILVALHVEQEGKLASSLDKIPWSTLLTSDELFYDRWLLVYEAVGKGWIAPPSGDPAMSDTFFADARTKGIVFYDTTVPREIPLLSQGSEY